jgi:hypothetical protein
MTLKKKLKAEAPSNKAKISKKAKNFKNSKRLFLISTQPKFESRKFKVDFEASSENSNF